MATFEFEKETGDVEEATLLPVDWYTVEVIEEPLVRNNTVLRDMVGDEPGEDDLNAALEEDSKAGFTLFVTTKTVHPDVELAGRRLSVMLPFPSKFDQNRYDNRGMKVYDAKMDRVTKMCEAAGSESEGKRIRLNVGQRFQVYVKQGRSRNREELENQVDIFAGFKGVE